MKLITTLALVALLSAAGAAHAQPVTQPPNGDNQKASVSQWIGLVKVTIDYSSPDVTGPAGDDRRGKIWGQLVPYGLVNLGFGSCGEQCPWRAGANENTVFTVSHDVEVGGKPLAAGSYGLHMIPGEQEWTIIFSNNHSSWGSFSYDTSEDALRIEAQPKKSDYTHWLTYEFIDRQPGEATVALKWEDLMVPWRIAVPDPVELYVAQIQDELRGVRGFSHLGWAAAANYLLSSGTHPEQALEWAETAVTNPFFGQEDFLTLSALGRAQLAAGQSDEGQATLVRAVQHPTSNAGAGHQLGRQLITDGKPQLAMKIFEANYKQHDGAWPTEVGLARGYSALGQYAKALEHAKVAVGQAPDDLNRTNLTNALKTLEEGKDIN